MPVAVVDFKATEKFDLKSCLGGYVVLRRMSYGEKLSRTQMAMEMAIREGGKGQADEAVMKMMQSKVIEFEFANCIIDHNLEDENGKNLDFKNPINVGRLHPAIGEEINGIIDKMNTFEETEEAKN